MSKLTDKLREMVSEIFVLLARLRVWLSAIRFRPGWERGTLVAVGLLVMVYAGFWGYDSQSGYGRWVDILVPVIVSGIGYIFTLWVGSGLVRLLLRLPVSVWVMIILGYLAGSEVWGNRTWQHWVFNLTLVVSMAMLGTGIYTLVRGEWGSALKRQKISLILLLVGGTAGVIFIGGLILSPGQSAQPLPVQVLLGKPNIKAQDPSQPGNFSVEQLTYGSGTDQRRPEFGAQADLLTESVNAASYVSFRENLPEGLPEFLRNWEPLEELLTRSSDLARKNYWGFGVNELPLNGRVWYPNGDGPFPLVLIVHGNHNMVDFSDTGYAYLGELLASRGFIVVSVDENFLNGGFWGKSSGENDARAWMLLKHLEVWEQWSEDPDSPFYGKADLSRIALIGHSRGGEAAALAATFNQLTRYPNNARIRWDFNFDIRSVVAIAPVDGQWLPSDHPNPLTDINYLVIQGSHDGDLFYFDGIQQYNRAFFTGSEPNLFKAAVYIYRANHGQFNSNWSSTDKTGIAGQFLNRKALLPQDAQQQIAKLYISAFLETTLLGNTAYTAIFEDYRNAGNWLPQTGYISQYEDYGIQYTADFEEDIDVTTSSLIGGRIETGGLDRWNEVAPRFRNQNRQDNHVVRIDWSSTNAYYVLTLPNTLDWEIGPNAVLVFKAADARKPEADLQGLDFTILLKDRYGMPAEMKLSELMPLQTQFPAQISRLTLWNLAYYQEISEEVFQTYRIPLKEFLRKNPQLDLTGIRQIRFHFDQMDDGIIYLDEIGFDLIP